MLSRFSRREQIFLALGGTIILVTLIFLGIVAPYREALSRLDSRIASRQQQLREIGSLRQKFLQLKEQIDKAEAGLGRQSNFSLLSFIETVSLRIIDKENLVYMRPQPATVQNEFREESVEIKLAKIDLEQLIRLLYEIENAPTSLKVKNLRIKSRFEDRSLFDAVLTIAAYGRAT